MDAAEHFDEVDAVECPFLDCEVEFFHPMLICARHRCERLSAAADLPTGGLRPQGEAGPDRRPRRWRLRDRVAVEALRRRRLSPDRQDPPGACPAGTHRASMAAQSFGVFHKDPIRRAPLHAECSRQRGGIGDGRRRAKRKGPGWLLPLAYRATSRLLGCDHGQSANEAPEDTARIRNWRPKKCVRGQSP